MANPDCCFGGMLVKDDFGYFGSGLEGYYQYNEAFRRNFDSVPVQCNEPADDDPDNNESEDYDDEDLEDEGKS